MKEKMKIMLKEILKDNYVLCSEGQLDSDVEDMVNKYLPLFEAERIGEQRRITDAIDAEILKYDDEEMLAIRNTLIHIKNVISTPTQEAEKEKIKEK